MFRTGRPLTDRPGKGLVSSTVRRSRVEEGEIFDFLALSFIGRHLTVRASEELGASSARCGRVEVDVFFLFVSFRPGRPLITHDRSAGRGIRVLARPARRDG